MTLIPTASELTLADEVNGWLSSVSARYSARSGTRHIMLLPAGESLRPVYAAWRARPHPALGSMTLVQLDDIVTGPKSGMFASFFKRELPGFKVIEPLAETKADFAILGLGTNGHVAFHEPHVPASHRFGNIRLSDDTAERLGVVRGTIAWTHGTAALKECQALLLVVSGEKKRSAFARFLAGDHAVPASALRDHPGLTIITDIAQDIRGS